MATAIGAAPLAEDGSAATATPRRREITTRRISSRGAAAGGGEREGKPCPLIFSLSAKLVQVRQVPL